MDASSVTFRAAEGPCSTWLMGYALRRVWAAVAATRLLASRHRVGAPALCWTEWVGGLTLVLAPAQASCSPIVNTCKMRYKVIWVSLNKSGCCCCCCRQCWPRLMWNATWMNATEWCNDSCLYSLVYLTLELRLHFPLNSRFCFDLCAVYRCARNLPVGARDPISWVFYKDAYSTARICFCCYSVAWIKQWCCIIWRRLFVL